MIRFVALCLLTFLNSSAEGKNPRPAKMSFLSNEQIKIGVDLNLGGAITYLSVASKDDNMVNNWDWGRQIQMSHYAGPVPFEVGDKKPAPHWKHLGWNPVQAGDDFRNPSRVLESRNDGKEIYIKCIPMQWPLNNVPSECVFESWISLAKNIVNVRSKITMQRKDITFYAARMQELPAIYVNAPYHRLMTYRGSKPGTNEAVSVITYKPTVDQPWTSWLATECWSALVNDQDFGVGVCHPGCFRMSGGFAGKPGRGGTHDVHTGYLAPNHIEHLDPNGEFEHRYHIVVGNLDEIRSTSLKLLGNSFLTEWVFSKDRQHWHLVNATDTGWPIRGELNIDLSQNDPQLVSPAFCVDARKVPKLYLHAAFKAKDPNGQVYWSTHDQPGLSEKRSNRFKFINDGEFHEYMIDLSQNAEWKGTITDLRIDPTPSGEKGAGIRVKSIRLGK